MSAVRRRVGRGVALAGGLLLGTACGTSPLLEGLADVERVEILVLESFPVQVHALVEGHLADPCTHLEPPEQRREGQTFWVTLTTSRDPASFCAQLLVPFTTTVSLDVLGLKAGTYTVDVNGVAATFTLAVDNAPQS